MGMASGGQGQKCGDVFLCHPSHSWNSLPMEQGLQRPCLWSGSKDSTLALCPSVALWFWEDHSPGVSVLFGRLSR